MSNKQRDLLRSSGIIGKVTKVATKFYYKLRYDVNVILNTKTQSEAWIFGTHLYSFEQIIAEVNKIIWMTYREDMGKSQLVGSDVGWGCMLRVGQMMFAEAFKRALDLKQLQDKTDIDQLNQYIISSFIDSVKQQYQIGQYSIQNICSYAINQLNMKIGQWYNPANISHSLASLHKNDPLVGTSKMIVKITQCLNLDSLRLQMISKEQSQLLLIFTCMLGHYKAQQSKLTAVKSLMKLKQFNGMLGGIPKKAFYFVGITNSDRLIYLDPHFVQSASTVQNVQFQTYFCQHYLSIPASQLQPSVGISFYFKNLNQLQNFCNKIFQMKQNGYQIPFSIIQNSKSAYDNIVQQIDDSGSFSVPNFASTIKKSSVYSRPKEMTQAFEIIQEE